MVMTNSDTKWVPPFIWGIVLGAVFALIATFIIVRIHTPNPNLQVLIAPSAKGKVADVGCSVDAQGNADASGLVSVYNQGVLKIGAEFYSPNNQLGSDSGPVYTYYDTSDADSGQGSGVIGFSVVSPAQFFTNGRPTACKITTTGYYDG